jgi:predicted HNH restriction endonuclease
MKSGPGPILEELATCKPLCHNCHAEVHNSGLDLAKLSIEPTALTTELRALNIPLPR